MAFWEQARLQASGQDQGRHGDLHAASSPLPPLLREPMKNGISWAVVLISAVNNRYNKYNKKKKENNDIKASAVTALKDLNDKWVIKQLLFALIQLLFYERSTNPPLLVRAIAALQTTRLSYTLQMANY